MRKLSVSIILPTYNELENVKILAPLIHEVLSDREHEIIVVDDNSPDGTGAAVQALAAQTPQVRLLNNPRRRGIGAALRYGYDHAGKEVIVSMDADLSFQAADILRLLEQIEAGNDLVLGCRHCIPGSGYQTPRAAIWLKYTISRLGNFVVRRVTGVDIKDFSANFRAIRAKAWHEIKTVENTNAILLEMILKVHGRGYRIREVPVVFVERVHGQSKLNLFVEVPKFLFKLIRFRRLYI